MAPWLRDGRFACVLTCVFAVSLAASGVRLAAKAQFVTDEGDGLVSVRSEGAPFGQLLRELAALTPMWLRIDPAVEGRPVTVDLHRVPVDQAIAAVVRNADVDWVVVGLGQPRGGGPIRVVAGDAARAVEIPEVGKEDGSQTLGSPPPPHDTATLLAQKDDAERSRESPGDAPDPTEANAPGNMSGERLMQALYPGGAARPARAGPVMLPFVTEDGQPVVEVVSMGLAKEAMLPFVDEVGQPIVAPILRRADGLALLPFPGGRGQPLWVPTLPLPSSGTNPWSTVPGVVVGSRVPPR